MIEPYNGVPINPLSKLSKLNLNSFPDDHTTTTTLQIRPKYIYSSTPFTVISPFNLQTPFYFKQALYFPINKRHSFGIQAEIFKHSQANMKSFGLVYEYTNIHDSKFVVKGCFGGVHNCSLEYHKRVDHERIVSLYCSSTLSLRDFYSSCGIGYKRGRFQTVLTQRLGFGGLLKSTYRYPLYKGVTLKLSATGTFLPETVQKIIETHASLDYEFHKIKGSLIVNGEEPTSIRVQFQARTIIGRIFLCNQFVDNQNIIYIGLKRHNCKFAIPVAATNSLAVTVMFGIAYLIGFLLRKDSKDAKQFKLEADRIKELRLIEDKAKEFYQKQDESNGLRIQTAYYGEKQLISQIFQAFETNSLDAQRQGDLSKTIDVTVPLRYYTQKGKLKLPKTTKSTLLGFCNIDTEDPKLLIIYKNRKSDKLQARVFDDFQSVEI